METRKEKEIAHYDTRANEWLHAQEKNENAFTHRDFEGFLPNVLSSYQYCYKLLSRFARGKKVLDFGCGNGVHLPYLASLARTVVGVDLSAPSLEIAKHRIAHLKEKEKITLQQMDCEQLEFPANSFDVVFDGGTFSSLDFERALKELSRILVPDGCIIGIETFGHNPFTNLKRMMNKKTGKRTSWAASHILTNAHLGVAKNYFQEIRVYYFHIASWLAFPFLGKPGGMILLRILEAFDRILFLIKPLRTYAFKIVFVLSKPCPP